MVLLTTRAEDPLVRGILDGISHWPWWTWPLLGLSLVAMLIRKPRRRSSPRR